ncbi:Serine/threonine protein kinase [Handroanthus impetiginosus]|uniref:non-specific serine/threonine protein kinase n=1 Tax=Handroanthus impetiginosus TaxID=429701 RepID=A0A2G9HP04_9LAMI|nr:Serine/threonine protein kinase [Handroanthus impetiginosus]
MSWPAPEAPTDPISPPFSNPPPTDSPPSPPSFNPRSRLPQLTPLPELTPLRPSPPFPSLPPFHPSPPFPRSSNDGSSGILAAWVVRIVIIGAGVILFVVIQAVLSLLFVCCKKKKRRRQSDHHVPPPPPPAPRADSQGGLVQNWQQNAPPPPNHVITVPPKPSPPPAGASRPPYYGSGSGSGSNYSGPETAHPHPSPSMDLGFSMGTFTYEDLAAATDGFSKANLFGQGGFGFVHKGILPNGKEVAIEQLKGGSGQGECKFQAEVEIISRVHHKHLVSLVGYRITGTQRMLVYEFVRNNTLEFHLHGKDWSTQLKIALGAVKGLAYLHEDCHPKITHRDIKSSNILLDFSFEAKVADFGLAKFASDADTHVSTRAMGTFGYLAPEYASPGKLTEKSDVFSFGVVLLELIIGRRPVDKNQSFMHDSLVDWATLLLTQALEEGNFDAIVDQRMKNDHNQNEMAQMVACAAACVRHSAKHRPRMSQVVRALEGDVSLSDLKEGIRPGQRTVNSSYGSSDYNTTQYKEDIRKFRKMALTSQECGSSDQYSNPTSKYGLYSSGSRSKGQQTGEMEMGKMQRDSKGFSGRCLFQCINSNQPILWHPFYVV